jgi:hypothetical protein
MLGSRRLPATVVAVALAIAAVSPIAPPAHAFVSPGYHASRARRTLVGTWRIVGNRKGGVAEEIDPAVRLDITTSTMRRRVGTTADPNVGHYEVVHEDETSLDLRVTFSGEVLDIDVLVETPNAMTFYMRLKGDDDEERALRLERVEE